MSLIVLLLPFFAEALLQCVKRRELILALLEHLDDKVEPSCNASCFQDCLKIHKPQHQPRTVRLAFTPDCDRPILKVQLAAAAMETQLFSCVLRVCCTHTCYSQVMSFGNGVMMSRRMRAAPVCPLLPQTSPAELWPCSRRAAWLARALGRRQRSPDPPVTPPLPSRPGTLPARHAALRQGAVLALLSGSRPALPQCCCCRLPHVPGRALATLMWRCCFVMRWSWCCGCCCSSGPAALRLVAAAPAHQ